MTKIKIVRKWNFVGAARSYKIIHNGEVIDYLKNNSQFVIEVDKGQHTFQFKLDSSKSNQIHLDIQQDDEINLETEFNLKGFFSLLITSGLLAFFAISLFSSFLNPLLLRIGISVAITFALAHTIWKERLYKLKVVNQ